MTADHKDMLERQSTLSTPGYEGFQYAQTMASFPPAAHDVFRFDDLLTQEERDIRYRTRSFMVRLSRAPSLPPCSAEAHAPEPSTSMWGHGLAWTVLEFSWMLTQEKEVAPVIADYWEHAAFPFQLVPRLAKLGLGGATLKGYGCPGQSVLGTAMAVIEIARVDASMSTFIMVHNSLAMLTIGTPLACSQCCNRNHVMVQSIASC